MIAYLLIFGSLFLAATCIGCLISMNTFGNNFNDNNIKKCPAGRTEFCIGSA